MSWEGPRVVKVSYDDIPFNVHLVLVRDPAELARLGEALREYVRQDDADNADEGPEPASLVEFLETRQFTLPCTYSAHWPFEREIGE